MSIMTVDIAPRQLGDPVYVSQGDIGRVINVHMYDGDDPYIPPAGVVPYIQGLKPSGLGFNVQGTITDNICTFSTTDEMTDEVGDMVAEVRLIKTGMDIGTANFRYSVEERPRPDGTTDGTIEVVTDVIAEALEAALEDIDTARAAAVAQVATAAAVVARTVAEMTDESAVYLYTGSETGYTAGNWYYYDGSAWTSGGIYGGAVTDTTLSISGAPADAKAVGDALALKANAADVTALTTVVAGKADSSDVTALDTRVTGVEDALADKYDRYTVTDVSGLSLDMFDICPSLYTITTHLDTDALTHGSLSGSGLTYLRSKLKSEYSDFKFKVGYVSNSSFLFALAVTDSFSIGFALNSTSGNVSKYTDSATSGLTGILRNSNCRNVTANDTLHFVKDGTKVALYLVDNNIDVPIFKDEWVDILTTYANKGITSENIGFGFVTGNSARNNILVYDFTHEVKSGDHFMAYDEVDGRLSALEDGAGFNPSKIDLFMFMGQSNMAGRGGGNHAPAITAQAGYEYRAISDPTKLYPITEPFGVDENVQGAIYDYLGGYKAKTGDLVPAFVNAYFAHTHVSIVGVSASEGGTRISLWQPDTARYTDALNRFTTAIAWLEQNGYTIRHKYMLWCQGESDGDNGMSKVDYISAFTTMANAWFVNGIEKIFLIKIGNYNGTGTQDYNTIMDAQNEICQTMQNVIMVSTDFAGMKDRGLMKDDFHYYQAAYNEVGEYAGINAALYVNTGKEPTMYDTQDGTLYFTHKN